MRLLIDTSSPDQIAVYVLVGKRVLKGLRRGDFKVSEHLLRLIDAVMHKNGLSLLDIDAIGVVEGPGPFTSLRIGVSVANTLGYALSVPVIALTKALVEPELNQTLIQDLMAKKKPNKAHFDLVIPVYGGAPNVTIKKER